MYSSLKVNDATSKALEDRPPPNIFEDNNSPPKP